VKLALTEQKGWLPAVAGTVYFVAPKLQLDMRGGVGLNHHSNDLLAGVGFAARY
jgi:hypothetical protein